MFKIDTNKITFDLGGSFLLNIADLLIPIVKGTFAGPVSNLVTRQIRALPDAFNGYMIDNNGFVNFGSVFWKGNSPYTSLTVDLSLDETLRVHKNRLEFSINGTFFNNDRVYKIPKNP